MGKNFFSRLQSYRRVAQRWSSTSAATLQSTNNYADDSSAGRRGVVYWFVLEDEMMTLNITLDLPETVLTELESSSLHGVRLAI